MQQSTFLPELVVQLILLMMSLLQDGTATLS